MIYPRFFVFTFSLVSPGIFVEKVIDDFSLLILCLEAFYEFQDNAFQLTTTRFRRMAENMMSSKKSFVLNENYKLVLCLTKNYKTNIRKRGSFRFDQELQVSLKEDIIQYSF